MPEQSSMATDLSTLPNSALLLQIVSAERDCLNCFGTGFVQILAKHDVETDFCGCNKGKVPILDSKLMRLPCPWCDGKGDGCLRITQSETEPHCQGRNWVPNPDAWDLLKALHLAGYKLVETSIRIWLDGQPYSAAVYKEAAHSLARVWDADPERARFLSIIKSFQLVN